MFSFCMSEYPETQTFSAIEESMRSSPITLFREFADLMAFARERKMISSRGFPHIDELTSSMGIICGAFSQGLEENSADNPTQIVQAMLNCAYAGIGLTTLWFHDSNALRHADLLPFLLGDSTPFELEKHVCNTLLKLRGEEETRLIDEIHLVVQQIIQKVKTDGALSLEEACLTLYLFGIAYQMDHLGIS